MLKKVKRMALLFLLGISLVVPTVASAETQTGHSTRKELTIVYSLKCNFSLNDNDTATATTTWAGKTGFKVKTKLYHCQNVLDDYHLIGTSLEARTAKVYGSIGGVWKFKSKHYFHTNKTSSADAINSLLTEFTDW